ncbi:metallophosphoesterase [Patescibacteria group bacterium]|nr:MAG: metallophosphoesterase [Patescibacteria group bacterium]
MKIAIISDTHDNLQNLRVFFDFAKKENIKAIIHCGDTAHGETLEEILKNFSGPVFLSFGNMDFREEFSNFENNERLKIFEKFGQTELDSLKIGFCHFPELAMENSKKYDFIFYGHTHKPWLEKIGNCFVANPGNLAGQYYAPSFAVLKTETKHLSLVPFDKLQYATK